MGYEELIAALAAEGERTVQQMRDAAAEKNSEIERETDMAVLRMKDEYRNAAAVQARIAAGNALASAAAEAKALRVVAENELAEKLYLLATESLSRLREEVDDAGFSALTKTTPPHAWGTIRVNPADRERAEKMFPGTAVIPDAGIAGGAEICSSDGSVCIVSTYEKMLEMAWPLVLPAVMDDIRRGLR